MKHIREKEAERSSERSLNTLAIQFCHLLNTVNLLPFILLYINAFYFVLNLFVYKKEEY